MDPNETPKPCGSRSMKIHLIDDRGEPFTVEVSAPAGPIILDQATLDELHLHNARARQNEKERP